MKTLLLGGGGFIGQALIPVLSQHLDLTVATSQEHLKVPQEVRKTRIVGSNYQALEGQLDFSEYERVIDCTWEGLPNLSDSMNERNLASKLALINYLSEKGIVEYNGFGSCLEYGSRLGVVDEATTGLNVSSFGLAKLKVLEALQSRGLPFRWFRPFYLVGPRQHPNSLFNSAYESFIAHSDFAPRSSPDASYDFIYITDFAFAVSAAMQSDSVWGVTNVGSGAPNSIQEVLNEFRLHFGLEQKTTNNSPAMFASINKLTSLTGWQPKRNLAQMVSTFIQEKGGKQN